LKLRIHNGAELAAAAVSGAALSACFPLHAWDWLAWFALAPLFIAIARARSGWSAWWSGYLAGAVFFGLSCPWIAATVRNYGGLSPAVAGFVFLLFLGLMGSYLALFAWLGYWIGRRSGHRVLPLPFLWVGIELLRTYTPMGGFPWNLLGYSQVSHAGFMLIAPWAGVYGPSLVVAAVNALLSDLAMRFYNRRGEPLSAPWPTRHDAWLGVGVGVILAFATLPYHPPSPPIESMSARLVQPDSGLGQTWTSASLARFLRRQEQLSTPLHGRAVDLILWPEQPAPLDYALQPGFQEVTAEMLSRARAAFLFSEVTFPRTAQGLPNYNLPRNSSLMIHADGTTGRRYDKMHLVPFGEYVPLPEWVQHLAGVGKLVRGVGDFVPGGKVVLFHAQGHPFATLICYESIFPQLARQEVLDGAQWLVNQSDDGWYGHSSAMAQGLMMARMRAIENRRWLLRDTNSGLTAVIDPYGRVRAELPPFRAGALVARFSPRTQLTFYTRYGDWLAYLCVLITAGFAVLALARHRRRSPAREVPCPPVATS
jgi:apolipoprotein N-acyltransferase